MLDLGKHFFAGIKRILIYQPLIMYMKAKANFGMQLEMIWVDILRNKPNDISQSILANVVNSFDIKRPSSTHIFWKRNIHNL